MDKHALLKRYCQPDEKLLLAKVLDQADLSLRKHIVSFSDFLSPSETAMACEVLNKVSDINFIVFGGYDESERKMISVFPDYFDENDAVFPISAVEISYNVKFSSGLSHRDFLGSILGLGIQRDKVGDIVVTDECTTCFVESGISDYIVSGLERVGRTKVDAKIIEINNDIVPQKNMVTKSITVASLRSDAVFGAVFGESRSNIQQLINAEKASVNWIPVKSSSAAVKEGDVLSLKGGGRGILLSVNGETKKGRISITIGKYV